MVTTPSLDGYSAEDMKDWIIPQTINRLHELAARRDVEMGHYGATACATDVRFTPGMNTKRPSVGEQTKPR